MRALLVVTALALLAGCGDSVGSCVASGGIVDSCKQDWTEAECQTWNDQKVNDATWTFSSDSCDSLGFSATCPDGTRVRSTSDC